MRTLLKRRHTSGGDWLRAGRPWLDFREGHGLFLRHRVKTGSGTHPASYSML